MTARLGAILRDLALGTRRGPSGRKAGRGDAVIPRTVADEAPKVGPWGIGTVSP